MVNEFFGIGVTNLIIILSAVGLAVVYAYPQIAMRFGKFKPDIGTAFWHYYGVGGTAYSNLKVKDYNVTPFGKYNIHFTNGISLTNLNLKQDDDDCDAIIIQTVSALGGIVDVACRVDAMNQHNKWNSRFDGSMAKIRDEIQKELLGKVKKDILEVKEYQDIYSGQGGGMGMGMPQFPQR